MWEDEIIGKILESEFGLDEQAELSLIACDMARATFFVYSIIPPNFGKPELWQSWVKQNISQIKAIISQAINSIGLSHCFGDEHTINNGQWIIQVCIARNMESAKHMQYALRMQDHETIGRLHGFPKTAIETFVQGRPHANVILPFLSFAMSAEHFEEELLFWKKWVYVIRDKCPKLFNALVNQSKEKGFSLISEEL